jgi:hypothetical protein
VGVPTIQQETLCIFTGGHGAKGAFVLLRHKSIATVETIEFSEMSISEKCESFQ